MNAEQVAKELGVDITPKKRAARKRTPNRNGPVVKTVAWKSIPATTRLHWLMMANQDIRRIKVIDHTTAVILNNPGKVPR